MTELIGTAKTEDGKTRVEFDPRYAGAFELARRVNEGDRVKFRYVGYRKKGYGSFDSGGGETVILTIEAMTEDCIKTGFLPDDMYVSSDNQVKFKLMDVIKSADDPFADQLPTCQDCGAEVEVDHDFCANCGVDLSGSNTQLYTN